MTTIQWNTRPLTFYSQLDEKAFFDWLESIPGVIRVEGRVWELMIHLRSRRIAQTSLRDLLAIYHRYGGDMSQLAQFLNPQNERWFKAPGTYWYKRVFL
jgi:hypothetical protein